MTFDFNFISTLSIIAPLIVGVIFYRRQMSATKVIFYFVLVTAIMEVVVRVMAKYSINNMPVFHAYTIIEFGFILLFYKRLNPTKDWRQMLGVLAVLFGTFSILNLLFIGNVFEFNSQERIVEVLLISIILLRFLFDSFQSDVFSKKDPFFIQTAGFFIYFSGTLFLFTFGTELLSHEKTYYWAIHAVFNILLNISYTITLWRAKVRFS